MKSADVTLVTGDRFRVDVAEDGSQQASPLTAGKKSSTFAQFSYGGDTYVIPAKAAPYLGTTLDPRLFDVGYLVRAKLDDKHAKTLPVTLKSTAAKAEALPGTSVTSSSGGTVRAKVAKKESAKLGALLAKNWRTAAKGGSVPALAGVKQVGVAVPSGAPKLPAAPPLAQSATAKAVPQAAAQGVRFHNLTVDSVDLDGKPGVVVGFVHNVNSLSLGNFALDYPGDGKRAFSVPEGTYSIEASVFTGPASDLSNRAALVIEPEITVSKDTTVTLDARKAVQYKPTLAAPPRPDMPRIDFMSFIREDALGNQTGVPANGMGAVAGFFNMRIGSASSNGSPNLYVTPTKPVTKGKLHFLGVTSLTSGTGEEIGAGPTYKMVLPSEGAISANQAPVLAASDFTTVKARLHDLPSDDPTNGPLGYWATAFLPWTWTSIGFTDTLPAGDRTDYLYSSAPDQVVWEWSDNLNAGMRLNDLRRTVKPGQVIEQDWNGAPLTPSIAADYVLTTGFNLVAGSHDGKDTKAPVAQMCAACRQDDLAALYLKGGGDNDPTHHYYWATTGNRVRFYRNGELAYTSDIEPEAPNLGPTNLPMLPRAADYRLIWSANDENAPGAVSTTDWTFRSAPGGAAATLPKTAFCGVDTSRGCSFVPLLFVNYDLTLDEHSRAKAGQAFDVGFRVSHQQYQAAPTGVTATVEVSYDDGDTWSKPVDAAANAAGVFHAQITHPAYDQEHRWVSLRVTAHGTDGASVTQTNIHAYRLDG
ncbi:hypothetical protein J4573_05735 [Actinomadura barringtoniae]|uniref:Uncharacterized protein n=1 Tax=Actinomadura barringtoniae TaxID=1427535 RepID=A0A939P7K3_9ACTN|nr:hypothetical protein [Actinomadura barringtoniae]MBO2446582.1 hypothetical protein [Actinomadura barringtoniae]